MSIAAVNVINPAIYNNNVNSKHDLNFKSVEDASNDEQSVEAKAKIKNLATAVGKVLSQFEDGKFGNGSDAINGAFSALRDAFAKNGVEISESLMSDNGDKEKSIMQDLAKGHIPLSVAAHLPPEALNECQEILDHCRELGQLKDKIQKTKKDTAEFKDTAKKIADTQKKVDAGFHGLGSALAAPPPASTFSNDYSAKLKIMGNLFLAIAEILMNAYASSKASLTPGLNHEQLNTTMSNRGNVVINAISYLTSLLNGAGAASLSSFDPTDWSTPPTAPSPSQTKMIAFLNTLNDPDFANVEIPAYYTGGATPVVGTTPCSIRSWQMLRGLRHLLLLGAFQQRMRLTLIFWLMRLLAI